MGRPESQCPPVARLRLGQAVLVHQGRAQGVARPGVGRPGFQNVAVARLRLGEPAQLAKDMAEIQARLGMERLQGQRLPKGRR